MRTDRTERPHTGRVGTRRPLTVVPPFHPGAVVFDLDGVLVDSEDLWGVAERRAVEDLGHRWDPSVQAAMVGRGALDAARVLAEHLGAASARAAGLWVIGCPSFPEATLEEAHAFVSSLRQIDPRALLRAAA